MRDERAGLVGTLIAAYVTGLPAEVETCRFAWCLGWRHRDARLILAVCDGKQRIFDECDHGIGRSGSGERAGAEQRAQVGFRRVRHIQT